MEVVDFMGNSINKDLQKDELNERECTMLVGMIDVLRYTTSDVVATKLMLLGLTLMLREH